MAEAERPELSAEELAELRALRRQRREERRAKQRVANVGRAAKMHAARVAWEKEHPEPEFEPRAGNYVGCSGWYYWHWKGLFYPEEIPRAEWFSYYASKFRTVELNAPFYSWPTVATVRTWVRQAAGVKDFTYTVKVSELITHVKRFVGTKTLVRDFSWIAELVGERMGCFLFQLPPSFQYTSARLKGILGQMDERRRNVVEFRHRSWWREEVYRAFRDAGVIFCSCSGPRLPGELVKTADDVYLRFHGTRLWYRHDYTSAELAVWVKRVRDAKPVRTWAYFNNDREGYAIKNANEFLKQLKRRAT